MFLGVVFLLTAVAGFLYAGVSRLSAPRYATVIAVQPVPLLLAYPVIESPAGWGMTLAVVALIDLLLLTTVIRSGRLVPRWPIDRPGPADRESMADADDPRTVGAADFADRDAGPDPADAPPRPESRPEEPDLIIRPLSGARRRWLPTRIFPGRRPAGAPAAGTVPLAPPASPPSADWLRELTFALLCAAVAGSLLYAGGALIGAQVGARRAALRPDPGAGRGDRLRGGPAARQPDRPQHRRRGADPRGDRGLRPDRRGGLAALDAAGRRRWRSPPPARWSARSTPRSGAVRSGPRPAR